MANENIRQYSITPKNVISLKEILSLDGEDKDCYEFTEACVRACLFSRFPQRREFALKRLKQSYNPNLEVHALEDGGTIYAYLSLTKEKEAFLFVERYIKMNPLLEPVPTEKEKSLWAENNII